MILKNVNESFRKDKGITSVPHQCRATIYYSNEIIKKKN